VTKTVASHAMCSSLSACMSTAAHHERETPHSLLFRGELVCARKPPVKIGRRHDMLFEWTPARWAAWILFSVVLIPCLVTPQTSSACGVPCKKSLVHDPAPNEMILQGDNAIAAQDYARAMQRFQAAVADTNPVVRASASNRIGELYEWGFGVKQDYAESASWYQKSASLGNRYAAANLGNSYFLGLGVEQDFVEALRWAQLGAEQNLPLAMNQLGWQYLNGLGVTPNLQQAVLWYGKSAEIGDPIGQYQFGWIYGHIAPVNYVEAMRWYRKAAEQGHEIAQNNIGYLYENGLGVEKDFGEAARWYQMSASAGYVRAQFHLGVLYDSGMGVSLDKERAQDLIQKAAAQGDAEAVQWLAAH
jgi:TPR repeat protein